MDTKRGSPFPPLRLFSRSDVQILFRVTQSYWLSTPGSLPPCKPHRGARDEADLGLLHRNNWGFLGHSHTAALPHLRWLHTSPQENTMAWPCSCSGSNSHLALSTRTCTRAELVCLYFPFLQSSTMQSLLLLLPTLLHIGCYLFYFTSTLRPFSLPNRHFPLSLCSERLKLFVYSDWNIQLQRESVRANPICTRIFLQDIWAEFPLLSQCCIHLCRHVSHNTNSRCPGILLCQTLFIWDPKSADPLKEIWSPPVWRKPKCLASAGHPYSMCCPGEKAFNPLQDIEDHAHTQPPREKAFNPLQDIEDHAHTQPLCPVSCPPPHLCDLVNNKSRSFPTEETSLLCLWFS